MNTVIIEVQDQTQRAFLETQAVRMGNQKPPQTMREFLKLRQVEARLIEHLERSYKGEEAHHESL